VILTRNKNGQIKKKVEKLQGSPRVVYRYTYDNRGRLIKVKKGNQVVEKYVYDGNGNRVKTTSKLRGVTDEVQTYNSDDQIRLIGAVEQSYNDDGYLVEKKLPNGDIYSFEYGTLGELKKVITPIKTIEYLHNANNQRVAKKVDGVIVEKYLWANLTTLLAVYDANDTLVQRFEYADNRMPIAMTMNSSKYYLHYDQVGSLRAVSDSSHNIVKEVVYDSYGNILSDSNSSLKVPFGFAGGLYDSDTKLTRFGYRDYDAYTGKWTAKDPILFGGGDSNLYGYVLGDPVDFVDPTGKFADEVWAIAVAMGWGLGKTIEWLHNYYLEYEIEQERRRNLERWCASGSIGATPANCKKLKKELDSCIIDTADELTRSGAGLPGTSGGGPAPTDGWAPLIGEAINAYNQ